MSALTDLLANLPEVPGVYCMKNRDKKIIYVGKSVNLKSRVNSYWSDTRNLNFAKQSMISQVRDIEIFETRNELEALVLETNLIKEWKPKYNILMKDDKNLAYIRITSETIPEVVKTRSKHLPGIYFGPYTAGANVGEILKILRKLFHIRSCRVEFIEENGKLRLGSKAWRSIPCIDHYIGICPAPCMLQDDKIAQYEKNIEHLKSFLSGKSLSVIEELRNKMVEKAKALEFEEAQKLKLQIEQISKIGTKQIARDAIPGNYDAIVFIEKYEKMFFSVSEVRDGEIVGIYHTEADNRLAEEWNEVFEAFIARRYLDETRIPLKHLTLLLKSEQMSEAVADVLKSKHISIEVPTIGPKYELLNFTEFNLTTFAYKEEMKTLGQKTMSRGTQVAIMERLGYTPKGKGELVFECYDISHTAGQFTVASRAVIVNGKSDTTRYRKYKIKTLAAGMIDDFASLKEILTRRVLEAHEQNNWPDMIVIDGGKGQLSSVVYAIKEAVYNLEQKFSPFSKGVSRDETGDLSTNNTEQDLERASWTLPHFNICSLAKREEEVFVPGSTEPIMFQKGNPELMLLQRIRDESHRFAIGFNRAARSKDMKKNILDELPGFGPTTRKKLLKAAGSIDALGTIPREELEKILSKPQLQTLVDHGIIK